MAGPSTLRGLLWNDTERRPRAPWRLVVGLVLIVVGGVGGVVVGSGLSGLAGALSSAPAALVITLGRAAPLVGFVAGILLAAWLVDRRRLADLGLGRSRAWWTDLAFGLALGVALPGLLFVLELALGYLRVTGTLVVRPDPFLSVGAGVAAWLALALTLAYFVGVGLFEELLFRGYLLTNVAEGLDGWLGVGRRGALAVAVVLTSVGFGVAHSGNPNATALSLCNVSLFGGLFAASYLLTDRIAVAVGLHITWNFAISSLFGFPVSGITTPVTVLAVERSGPRLVTGGPFGPEGGALALVALVVGAGALLVWVRWREGGVSLRAGVAVPDLRVDDAETGADAADASADGTANRGG